jgi:signal transduction histidine kinase
MGVNDPPSLTAIAGVLAGEDVASRPAPGAAGPGRESGAGASRRASLLVIDDDPLILHLINRVLSRDYAVVLAGDGEEGLELARTSPPDLIISDIGMPRMNGQELLRQLRREPSLQHIPLIVLTADGDRQLRLESLRDGAYDFLVKPFSVDELRVRIANLVRMKRARDRLQEEVKSGERDIELLVAEVVARRAALEVALDTSRLARDQADKASQAKTAFLALISHELRTPLTMMRWTVDRWTARATSQDAVPATEVGRMDRAMERLESIVADVIERTRITGGRLELDLQELDLEALVEGLRLELEASIESKGLRLDIHVSPEARRATSDARVLRLILSSLLGNAIKYTDSGVLQLRVFIADGLVFAVSDSGCGIDAADHARIFEPFEHGERIENKGTPGLGLGLSLVRDLVAALGGQLTLRSQKAVGSIFTVTLCQHDLA